MIHPHIHAQKTPMPGFGPAAIRAIITGASGPVFALPKIVALDAASAARSR